MKGRAIGVATSISTTPPGEPPAEEQEEKLNWSQEWSNQAEFVDQFLKEPGLFWRYAGSEAVAFDILDPEDLKKWNDWLSKTYPEGAPRYLLETKPEPYVVGRKLIQYALFRRIEYRRLLKSKPEGHSPAN